MSFMAITEQPRRDATHKTTSAPKIFRAADGAILPPTVHALACLSRKPVNRPICAFSEHSVSPESRQILFLLSESQVGWIKKDPVRRRLLSTGRLCSEHDRRKFDGGGLPRQSGQGSDHPKVKGKSYR